MTDIGTYMEADEQYCKYGYIVGHSTVERFCTLNATWDKVDLSFCRPIDKDTEEIIRLTQVSNSRGACSTYRAHPRVLLILPTHISFLRLAYDEDGFLD